MSGSIGQLAGGLVGAWVGSFFGMPSLGFSIGSSLFASGQTIKADPGDLSYSVSGYGKFMGWGYGTYPVDAPFAVWASNFHAHKKTTSSGGKGGGGVSQEYYEYSIDIAFYLRDCTDGNPISGVRRIWNLTTGELIYDVGTGADAATLIQSRKIADNIQVLTGTSDQDPPALIEAAEGWSPGYRGHALCIMEKLKCGATKQVPLLRFEIAASASTPPHRLTGFNPGNVTLQWRNMSIEEDNGTVLAVGSENELIDGSGYWRDVFRSRYDLDGNLLSKEIKTVDAGPYTSVDATFIPVRNSPGLWIETNWFTYFYWSSWENPTAYAAEDRVYLPAGVTLPAGAALFAVNGAVVRGQWITDEGYRITKWPWVDDDTRERRPSSYWSDSVTVIAGTGTSTLYRMMPSHDGASLYLFYSSPTAAVVYQIDVDTLATVDQWAIGAGYGSSPANAFWVYEDKFILVESAEIRLFTLNADGTATLEGTYSHGDYISFPLSIWPLAPYMITLSVGQMYMDDLLAAGADTLPAVLGDLVERAGVASADHDESLLPTTPVRLSITSQQAARDWLLQLSSLYHYRMRTSAGQLQVTPKGGSAVATIEQADLGMRPANGGAPVLDPPITTYAAQGIALPRSVTVVAVDPESDYAPVQQTYRMRNFGEGQDLTLRTTAILTADQCKDIATIYAKEPHLERLSWSTSVGVKHARYEAGDVLDLPQGRAWLRRVAESGDGTIEWELQAEAASAYTGQGLPTASPPVPSGGIALPGPTHLALLDPPALTDAHTGAGIVVAACGYLSGWSGCNLYVSDAEDGESYSLVATLTEAAVIGVAETALPDHAATMWDRTNSVVVRLVGPNGALSSATEAQVRAGGNVLLWGDEVVGVADVTYLGSRRYQLSTLLRGRRGTEWATSGHAAAETVVLLDSATLQRIDLDVSRIGAGRKYKAVSFGNGIADVQPVSFTAAGVSLEPWAPVMIRGSRDASGTLTVRWQRRGRFVPRPFWRPGLSDLQSYEVDIMSGSTVLRTLTSATESVTYTTAQMSTDGVTPNTPVSVRVYQLSTDVGRGYAGSATI
ncbi:phage tail protein [Thioalbus denitrificans]|uniref:Putative tail protein n=1 Tax=Thioalbus denitrificans TaxID=547122 RepID=A0A369CHC5_9GAMM|nr:phage tail protein [Thioalbus denitrificans]RCX32086.1 putative tail protein [Thioalbus denitrificans]